MKKLILALSLALTLCAQAENFVDAFTPEWQEFWYKRLQLAIEFGNQYFENDYNGALEILKYTVEKIEAVQHELRQAGKCPYKFLHHEAFTAELQTTEKIYNLVLSDPEYKDIFDACAQGNPCSMEEFTHVVFNVLGPIALKELNIAMPFFPNVRFSSDTSLTPAEKQELWTAARKQWDIDFMQANDLLNPYMECDYNALIGGVSLTLCRLKILHAQT